MHNDFYPYGVDWGLDRAPEAWRRLADSFESYARGSAQSAYDSFQRSDTDGALSQWASGQTARFCHAAADLARDHGMGAFPALFDADTGQMVPALLTDGDYGHYWRVVREFNTDSDTRRKPTVATLSLSSARSRRSRAAYYRERGYTQGTIRARARIGSRSAGSWQVAYFREMLWPNRVDVEIVQRDDNAREDNDATVTWDARRQQAQVTLTGPEVRWGRHPDAPPEIQARLLRSGRRWRAESDEAKVGNIERSTWKATLNAFIRACGHFPGEFEITEREYVE